MLKISSRSYYTIGLSLLLTIAAMPVMAAFCFYCGRGIGPAIFPIAVAGGLILTGLACRDWRPALLQAIVIASTLPIAYAFVDFSWDGQFYHQEFVAMLCGGWNPHDISLYPIGMASIWVQHYPHVIETSEACIVMTFGHLEMGKAINFILLVSTAFTLSPVMLRCMSKRRALIYCMLFMLNPIVVAQMFTFYIDFAVYCFMLLAATYSLVIADKPRQPLTWIAACALLMLAIGAKLIAFFYVGLVYIALAIWIAFKRRWKLFWTLIAAGLVTFVISITVSYHPYVTNIILKNNPLYPLVGADRIDIMTSGTPKNLLKIDNRFVNFFVSLGDPRVITTDTRVGGLGPVFIPSVLAAIALLIICRRRLEPWQWYILAWLVMSVFAFKECWWARYVPQAWIFPILVIMWTAPSSRILRRVILALIAINILTCGWNFMKSVVLSIRGHWIYSHLNDKVLIEWPRPQEVYKLREHGIECVHADKLDSSLTVNIMPLFIQVQVTPEQYEELKAADPGFDRHVQTRLFPRPGDPTPFLRH